MFNKSKTCIARFSIITPLGKYTSKGDEITNTKESFQDYVAEATALITNPGATGVASFDDDQGRAVFIMPETLQNSVITVEKVG